MVSNFTIRFTRDGRRRFDKLDKSKQLKILSKVDNLADFKKLNTVKQLQGRVKNNFRLRIGDIRVLFWVDDDNKIIWITDMGFRGSVYKR